MPGKPFFFALITALGLSAVFIAGFRKRVTWGNFFLFFAAVFVGSWVGGSWFSHLGPLWGKVIWLPFLIVGLVLAILLGTVFSPFPPGTTVQLLESGETPPEKRKKTVLGIYFWLLILALIFLTISRYL